MKIHFTSQTCTELFYSQSIIYEYLTWLKTGAFILYMEWKKSDKGKEAHPSVTIYHEVG